MTKPHGRDCPNLCSQCLGVEPRHVTMLEDGTVRIDAKRVDSMAERDARARARAMNRSQRGHAGRTKAATR